MLEASRVGMRDCDIKATGIERICSRSSEPIDDNYPAESSSILEKQFKRVFRNVPWTEAVSACVAWHVHRHRLIFHNFSSSGYRQITFDSIVLLIMKSEASGRWHGIFRPHLWPTFGSPIPPRFSFWLMVAMINNSMSNKGCAACTWKLLQKFFDFLVRLEKQNRQRFRLEISDKGTAAPDPHAKSPRKPKFTIKSPTLWIPESSKTFGIGRKV